MLYSLRTDFFYVSYKFFNLINLIRSTLHKGNREEIESFDCTPYYEGDRQAFSDYKKLVFSEHFEDFYSFNKIFESFPRIPNLSQCTFGDLTAEGALQLIKLGNFLRERYTSAGFLFDSGHF